ncbi:MAG: ABC transporter permease [Chitinispirillaceae bacterium]|nr:ABC transporter permease [Chitinispirillaceae bacterium]
MKGEKRTLFDGITLSVLLIFCGCVAILVVANVSYITAGAAAEVLNSPDIHAALLLTLITSLVTTVFSVLIAIPAAYALSRNGDLVLVKAADVVVDLLIVVPVLVVGVSILVFFRAGTIMTGSELTIVRLIGRVISGAGDLFIYRQSGIVLTQFVCSVPFAIRIIKTTFDEIPPRTGQVARTLGCTPTGVFFRLTLPMAFRGIIAGALLAWARAFGLFGPVSIVAGAVRKKTEVLATSIFLEISIGRLEHAITISLVMILIAALALGTIRMITGGDLFSSGRSR